MQPSELESPLIIIGEKINGTLAHVRDAVLERDGDHLASLALMQETAGADYIDVNVATGVCDEVEAMVWAVGVVRAATSLPLCLDSSEAEVLEAGLEICGADRPFINSVSGGASKMGPVLALAAEHSCPLVALPMDEAGIPSSPAARLDICHRIRSAAQTAGVGAEDLYFDPLVLPLSADSTQGRVTIETLAAIKEEMEGCRTVMGASNASFGLPARSLVNVSLMTVAVFFGLDAGILDPSDSRLRAALYAAGAVAGGDRFCKDYMKAYRAGLLE